MSFWVAVRHGSGHDDLDEANEVGENASPDFYKFNTEAECDAFLKGIAIASDVMDGFVNAWVEAEKVER